MKTKTIKEQIDALSEEKTDIAVRWHNATKELPKQSMGVLAITESGMICALNFSQKYKAFNVYDWFDEDMANSRMIRVAVWAHIPEWWNHMQDEEEE